MVVGAGAADQEVTAEGQRVAAKGRRALRQALRPKTPQKKRARIPRILHDPMRIVRQMKKEKTMRRVALVAVDLGVEVEALAVVDQEVAAAARRRPIKSIAGW